MGGEDFGGSISLARDGKLYLQAGKTGFWNVEVTGLETSADPWAAADRRRGSRTPRAAAPGNFLQETAGVGKLTVHRSRPS